MKPARFLGLTLMLAAASAFAEGSTTTANASGDMVTRVWHDTSGRTVQATFRGIDGENVLLQTANGAISAVPLSKLSPEDQKFARSVKLPESASTPAPAAPEATAPPTNQVLRTWHEKTGATVQATFRGIEDDYVYLQTANGVVAPVALERLTDEDQEAAKTLKPEGLGIPSDPYLPAFAQKIDEIVNMGLKAHGEKPNALASDEQFVRRVYLDLVGRIPTREETMEFLADTSSSKRAKVIDKLVTSDGFTSHMFNYFADMLRMTDDAQKAKFFTYEEWFKAQLKMNRPWDKIVFDMMTADGKLLENGATGYLLRDKGMRLDNLSLTLSTFLGANVACAQCHDHPFASWTQRDFYQMASFFGSTETYEKGKGKGGKKGGGDMKEVLASLSQAEQKKFKRLTQVNALNVHETGRNDVKLPDDYRYKDGKAGDLVGPKLVKWSPTTDVQKFDMQSNPAQLIMFQRKRDDLYAKAEAAITPKKGSSSGGVESPRLAFAQWMTSPDNPRFAMTIANRMWKLMFGIGVKDTINDLDDPNDSNNPVLLGHLANEMVRVKFDIRAFLRLLCNTQTYQREAITKQITPGEPYYFPGPVLRRMTAEQAWDSCVTLAIGEKVDGYKLHRAANYVAANDLKPGMNAEQIKELLDTKGGGKGGPGKGKGKGKNAKLAVVDGDEDDVEHSRPEMLQGLVLARASELPQPEKDQHFLRMFGQSDRQIADSDADEGSIPQVLMLMNGEAQNVLRNPKSRVLATAMGQKSPEEQVTSLYLSFFSRHPQAKELADGATALKSGMSVSDLTWVLFNSREFVFVQ